MTARLVGLNARRYAQRFGQWAQRLIARILERRPMMMEMQRQDEGVLPRVWGPGLGTRPTKGVRTWENYAALVFSPHST